MMKALGFAALLIGEGLLEGLAFAFAALLMLWLFDAAIYIECGPNQFIG